MTEDRTLDCRYRSVINEGLLVDGAALCGQVLKPINNSDLFFRAEKLLPDIGFLSGVMESSMVVLKSQDWYIKAQSHVAITDAWVCILES